MNLEIRHLYAKQAAASQPAKPSASETKAGEADPFQTTVLPAAISPEEQQQLDANLRGLALTLKRDRESDDEAFERIKNSGP
jgi:hypothetical protein